VESKYIHRPQTQHGEWGMDLMNEGFIKQLPARSSQNFTQIWDHSGFLWCSVCPLGTSIRASLFVLSVPLTFSLPLLLVSVEKTVKSVEVAVQSGFCVLICRTKTAKKEGRARALEPKK